jgi:hypothetical protein
MITQVITQLVNADPQRTVQDRSEGFVGLELPSQHELHLAVWRLLAVCSVAYQIDTYSPNTSA